MVTKGLIIVSLILGIFAGVQTMRLSAEKRDHAETIAEWDKQTAAIEKAAKEAEKAARTEETRRSTELTRIANESLKDAENARRDASNARAASDRLRVQLAALSSRQASSNPETSRSGESVKDSSAFDLLIGMLTRHTRELVEVGEYADRLRIAGETCERSYEALTQ